MSTPNPFSSCCLRRDEQLFRRRRSMLRQKLDSLPSSDRMANWNPSADASPGSYSRIVGWSVVINDEINNHFWWRL